MSPALFLYLLLGAVALGVFIFFKTPAGKRWFDKNS
jgi:hypothetical protein